MNQALWPAPRMPSSRRPFSADLPRSVSGLVGRSLPHRFRACGLVACVPVSSSKSGYAVVRISLVAPQTRAEHHRTGQYRQTEHSRKANTVVPSPGALSTSQRAPHSWRGQVPRYLWCLLWAFAYGDTFAMYPGQNPQPTALRPAVNRVHKHLHRSGTIVIKVWGPLCSSCC